jgi:hypothetical protein
MDSVERYFECNGPGVIFEQFEDETVVINLDSGHYYTLDAVGAAIWQRLTGPASLAGVVAELQREYEGDPGVIEAAIREFAGLLLGEQLIRPRVVDAAGIGATAPQRGSNGAARTKPAFKAPEMGKYNDMAEMLLLDPVHDVDGAGWPSAPGAKADAPTLVEDDVSAWPELKRG